MWRFVQRRMWHGGRVLGQTAQGPAVKSSCLAGTPLKLDIRKDGRDPVAMRDEEYPEWLWHVLEPATGGDASARADPLAARRKELRRKHRNEIKQSNYLSQL
ncbi:mitochondrial 54S ribosomal protein mL54 KNAG_0C01770 [Huiozyma naganishii CBS 8797]|uniref:Large ribosomal subunit protein mL54 n=1 Tax=Huiozyma naganishii (strain ATCC MYA-139 / BCRC 22969 / CBS 8797 / KCTC 17520 / NBRC 10181 / NCYC 3082 / Yp74L-3) TaxID=1071383 RepID=J7S5Q0_HUIN7|nr:hypothetical protein KNAG_0C01770 [Kazachstania naganishii CBS 8797]CCK69291.1 hypothetical protein KNAG_0C01770 [Kazachstania naganishii CBS 8797]